MGNSIWTGARPERDEFSHRHIGPSDAEAATMLAAVGAASLDALVDQTVPAAIRQKEPLGFGPGMTETEVLARLRAVASRNKVLTLLLATRAASPIASAAAVASSRSEALATSSPVRSHTKV